MRSFGLGGLCLLAGCAEVTGLELVLRYPNTAEVLRIEGAHQGAVVVGPDEFPLPQGSEDGSVVVLLPDRLAGQRLDLQLSIRRRTETEALRTLASVDVQGGAVRRLELWLGCGDGIVQTAERCDDANLADDDGCAACTLTSGFVCQGEPSRCWVPACGNGELDEGERCDDNNTVGEDGCSTNCVVERGYDCRSGTCRPICGDGIVIGSEACDDGNLRPGDGCEVTCTVSDGWTCNDSPSVCSEGCGDGQVSGAEACDDGDLFSGDGCSSGCEVEEGWSCNGSPSECFAPGTHVWVRAGCRGGEGTEQDPLCGIAAGLGRNVPVILLQAGTYSEAIDLTDRTVRFLGRGEVIIEPGDNEAVKAKGASTLVFEDIQFRGRVTSNKTGVVAEGTSTVHLERVTVSGFGGDGVESKADGRLSLSRVYLRTNGGVGAVLDGTGGYDFRNVVAIGNGVGVLVKRGPGLLLHLSILDNSRDGLVCEVGVPVVNTLAYDNPMGDFGPLCQQTACWSTNDPVLRDVNGHLDVGSPLIDAGDPTQTVSEDIDGEARPQGEGVDIGADEAL